MAWEAHEERTERDNFTHSIYEPGYKGILVARVNQNGRYPEHVAMILKASAGKREAAQLIEQQAARIDELAGALRSLIAHCNEVGVDHRRAEVINQAERILRKE